MKQYKESIQNLFNDSEIERVDYYVEKISESLKNTNKLYITYQILILITIISYFLIIQGQIQEITLLGVTFSDLIFLKRYFLLVPSVLFFASTLIGYHRTYQVKCIELLLAKYRNNEFNSNIFRLTFPSNFFHGLDLMKRQDTKWIKYFVIIPNVLSFVCLVVAPILYINFTYYNVLNELPQKYLTLIMWIICDILFLFGILIFISSEKI